MARASYGDLGFLSPKESFYTGPSGTVDAARVEGLKRASYLSQMDQFYAQLSAQKSQAREMIGLEREKLGLEREKMGLSEDALAQQWALGLLGAEGKKYGFGVQKDIAQMGIDWEREQSEESMEFLQDYFQRETGTEESEEGEIDFQALAGETEEEEKGIESSGSFGPGIGPSGSVGRGHNSDEVADREDYDSELYVEEEKGYDSELVTDEKDYEYHSTDLQHPDNIVEEEASISGARVPTEKNKRRRRELKALASGNMLEEDKTSGYKFFESIINALGVSTDLNLTTVK